MDTPKYTSKDVQRFWIKVNKNGSVPKHCPELGQCWEWQFSKYKNGYGKFSHLRKSNYTHRISWELKNGEIPKGLCVLHKCDNPCCVNPDHLFLGTIGDNNHDRDVKGRNGKHHKDSFYGVRHGAWAKKFNES